MAVVRPDGVEATAHAVAERRAEAVARAVGLMAGAPTVAHDAAAGARRVAAVATDREGGVRHVRPAVDGVATMAPPGLASPAAVRARDARPVVAAADRTTTPDAPVDRRARPRRVGGAVTSAVAVRTADGAPSVATVPTGGTAATMRPAGPAARATPVVARSGPNDRVNAPVRTPTVAAIGAERATGAAPVIAAVREAAGGRETATAPVTGTAPAGAINRVAVTADAPGPGPLAGGRAVTWPGEVHRTVAAVTGPCPPTMRGRSTRHRPPGCSVATTSRRCRKGSSCASCRCPYGPS